ncbi:MAG: AfsR/SARP family transcriptional regulator [Pseudonocardiaceae bacterium]
MVALQNSEPVAQTLGNWLHLLGGFRLELAGATVSVPVNGQRLLAYLSIRGAMPRADVAGTLWPEVSEHNAYGSLRTTMWRLHRTGAALIDTVGAIVALSPQVSIDVRVFADTAHSVLRRQAPTEQTDLEAESLALATASDLLPGWYDDWVIFERERLRQLRLHTLEVLATRLAEQRRFAAALDTALEAIRLEPLRESAHRVVIGIHLAEGNVAEAMRHFRFVTDLLRAELGIAPSGELTRLMPAHLESKAVTRLDMGR